MQSEQFAGVKRCVKINGDTVVFGGFAGVGVAEEIAATLESHYLLTGNPQNLTLMFAVATGPGNDSPRGLNHLAHEGMLRRIIGGLPAGGINFGAAINATALIDQPYQFDFYNGGGVDVAFLGMAEADTQGNINVSRFGVRLAGAVGFINISRNSKKVVFMGTFSASGVEYETGDGKLVIRKEGRWHKFVARVQHITFSGPYSARSGRKILYITERCVFELGPDGPELVEIAPGIDLQTQILDMMDFRPIIREPLAVMDERIFRPARMSLKDDLLWIPADDRIFYNPAANIMLANLAGYTVKSKKDVEAVRNAIERVLKPLGKKVYAVGITKSSIPGEKTF
jgi:propionate CoA-transferase